MPAKKLRSTSPARLPHPWRQRTLRIAVYGALFAAFLPLVEVALVRWLDPPFTPLMLLRQAESRLSGRHSEQRRYQWLPLEHVPQTLQRFVVISEDQRFFQHHGFDWQEIENARSRAIRTGKPARGASTITMQCARSLYLWQGRSWIRKGLEAYYTFWMETLLPKRRILELYVNVIEMGDGVYGVGAASKFHFGAPPGELSRQQCALLAAMLPNPREWDPRRPSARLSERSARILREDAAVRIPGWSVDRAR